MANVCSGLIGLTILLMVAGCPALALVTGVAAVAVGYWTPWKDEPVNPDRWL